MSRSIVFYIFSSIVAPFLGILIFLVFFLMIFQVFRIVDLLMTQDVEIQAVLKIFGHLALSFLPLAVPLSVFFSVAFAFSKICRESEYTAILSLGVSRLKVAFIGILPGLMAGITVWSLNQGVIPISKRYFRYSVGKLKSNSFLSELKSGSFFQGIPQTVLFTEVFDKESKTMRNIFIHYSPDTIQEKVILAESGKIKIGKNEIQDNSSGKNNDNQQQKDLLDNEIRIELNHGSISQYNEETKQLEKIVFESYDFPLAQKQGIDLLRNKASLMTTQELNRFLVLDDQERKERRIADVDIYKGNIERWNRLNTPFLCAVFALLGIFIPASGSGRYSNKNNAFRILLALIFYYSLYFSGLGLAKKGKVEASIAIIVPSIVLVFVAGNYYRRSKWQS